MPSMRAAAGAAFLALAITASAAAEPTDNNRRTPPPEADSSAAQEQRVCQIFAGGVVKIDGVYSAWREDWCGTLNRGAKAAICEPNADLKLWRLYWNDKFWIYVKASRHSKTLTSLCAPGAEAGANAAGPWNSMPPREDDVILRKR
jgi:hypothetical protein